ncbi:MAG: tRNA dihydrouridine synthase DusB [Ruminococcaceae bacterium]|nr:tRNA dihydrouridine synthase DusB [Oscillospiraceae bacterium]
MKLKPVKIGNSVVPHGLFLAPMAGFTDLEFREICHECGAEFSVTEMISAKAVCFGDKKTKELAVLSGSMTALQIFGHDPDDIETACRRLMGEVVVNNESQPKVAPDRGGTVVGPLEDSAEAVPISAPELSSVPMSAPGLSPVPMSASPCYGVDINMGCPVKKIVSSGDGSALMRDPELCRRLVEAAVRGSGDVPVTVKIRAGFDADHKNAVEVARACVAGGASAVFVHGRTREQFYAPSSDNRVIAAVRDALPPEIPVIGNGDIVTVEDADRMLRETGCDGIMIGRAALGDPWLFGRIAAAAEGISLPEPSMDERLLMARRLCRMVCERYGEARGVPMCRGRAGHFIRGISGAAQMRDRLCHATTLAEVERILGGE